MRLVLFKDTDGTAPLLDWLAELVPKARAKCRVRLGCLADMGHDLRRPEADYLRDGIYELRARHLGVRYRMLDIFHGKRTTVVSHGFTKQRAKVPAQELEEAIRRKRSFERDPKAHTYEEDL